MFPRHIAPREDSELGTETLIPESKLRARVHGISITGGGPEAFVALSFESRCRCRCRAVGTLAESSRSEGPSTQDVEEIVVRETVATVSWFVPMEERSKFADVRETIAVYCVLLRSRSLWFILIMSHAQVCYPILQSIPLPTEPRAATSSGRSRSELENHPKRHIIKL